MRKICILLYLFVLSLGFNFELSQFKNISLKLQEWPLFLIAISLLLIYIIPFMTIIYRFSKRKGTPCWFTLFSTFSGMYMTGWLASYGNNFVKRLFQTIVTEADVLNNFVRWFSAPWLEEVVKLAIALLIAYLIHAQKIQDYLIIGSSVGLGFQISEDIYYIFIGANKLDDTFNRVFSALNASISSHLVYTGILTTAIYTIYQKIKLKEKVGWRYWIWFLTPFASHFIWNSPWNFDKSALNTTTSIITAFTLFVAFDIFDTISENKLTFKRSLN